MRIIWNTLVGTLLLAVALSGCGADSSRPEADRPRVPHLQDVGSRAREYTSLGQLAAISSALVTAVPTGKHSTKPLPVEPGDSPSPAPTEYVEMHVTQVLSGDVSSDTIQLVSPGWDEVTNAPALRSGGPFLMYLAPAMYDADEPAGGYVVAGGPAGVYAFAGTDGEFVRVDTLSPGLPGLIKPAVQHLPVTTRTDAELLAIGPQ